MGFFSSRIELNNTIKGLENEVEKLKFKTADKVQQISVSNQKIAELNKKITELSQINIGYEKRFINTGVDCHYCYTTIQKDFNFCPKCGKKIDKDFSSTVQSDTTTSIFQTEQDLDSILINRYNGFSDKRIVIPSSINGKPVIGIWESVFEKCVSLEEVIFEEGCKYIGVSAFKGCENLKKVRLPKSLIEIEISAFSGCTSLEEIIIPPNVKNINSYAFSGCEKLKSIILPEKLKCISRDMLRNTGIEEITIPQSVLHIQQGAFSDTKLTEVELPRNLYSIGENAFGTSTLSKIIIHSNVEIIEKAIFGYSAKPTVYCAAGSKALLYARKYGLECVQIPAQSPMHREIGYTFLWLNLDSERDLSTLRKKLGVYKASTSSWQCRVGHLMTGEYMDIHDAKQMEERFIRNILAYSIWSPSEYSKRIERGTYWGKSEV